MDVLSDVLRAVRLTGAVFYDVEASAPWTAAAEPAMAQAPRVMPRFQHVMEYHVVAEGACWVRLEDNAGPPLRLEAGSVVVFPHGDAHVLSSEPDASASSGGGIVRHDVHGGTLPFELRTRDAGGDRTGASRMVCGFLGCDLMPLHPLLRSLPRMLHLPAALEGEAGWLGSLVRAAVAECRGGRLGGDGVLSRLSELLFIEAVRRYVEQSGSAADGWFAALADPQLGRALRLLHAEPALPWTLAELARRAATSRTVLVERFGAQLGMAPMAYLAQWRMQLAISLLAGGNAGLARIAEAVGYQSEAAFSRAFKRSQGVSPAHWRRRHLGGEAAADVGRPLA